VHAENMQIKMWQGSLQNAKLSHGKNEDSLYAETSDGKLVFID
jgi:hypothetical protein